MPGVHERTDEDGRPDSTNVDETAHERAGGATVIRFPSTARRTTPTEHDPRLRDLLGEVLREERRRQRRTLADVSDAAAVSLPYLSEIERGRKDVSSDLLDAVCDALDVPLVEVLDRCAGRLRARAQGGSGIQLRAA
jgi:XRE family transcriptional regulator, stress-response regulator